MMMGMAALQVLVVRFFFQGARKGEFINGERYGANEGRICLNGISICKRSCIGRAWIGRMWSEELCGMVTLTADSWM